jgi:hypothetical protein
LVFDELILTEELVCEPDILEPHPETDQEYASMFAAAVKLF